MQSAGTVGPVVVESLVRLLAEGWLVLEELAEKQGVLTVCFCGGVGWGYWHEEKTGGQEGCGKDFHWVCLSCGRGVSPSFLAHKCEVRQDFKYKSVLKY